MMTLTEQLILHEGLELKPYLCAAGKMTIGVGRNLEDAGISRDEALLLLRNDIDRIADELAHAIPEFRRLNATRQRVLIDMAFNLGVAGLRKFKKMLAALSADDYARASEEMLRSRWAKQVKGRAVQLACWMKTGKLPTPPPPEQEEPASEEGGLLLD